MNTAQAAKGHWDRILRHFGVPAEILDSRTRHIDCPISGCKKAFRFTDDFGTGDWICKCQHGRGFDLLDKVLGIQFKDAAREIDQLLGVQRDRREPMADPFHQIRQVLAGCQKIKRDDPVDLHLRRRGVAGVEFESIGLHPDLAVWDDGKVICRSPAMVALVRREAEDAIQTVHVTYLTVDGEKARVPVARKVLSSPNHGAVQLQPAADVMGVAEGIETALACRWLTGLPVWAALNANLLQRFQVPEVCTRLVVFADNDRSHTGQAAAHVLKKQVMNVVNRQRPVDRQVSVEIQVPEVEDTDFNDVLLAHLENENAHRAIG